METTTSRLPEDNCHRRCRSYGSSYCTCQRIRTAMALATHRLRERAESGGAAAIAPTRGIGLYPGAALENFDAQVMLDPAAPYRNLALLRPAFASSNYDYNLTAQLITDGIVDTRDPALVDDPDRWPDPDEVRTRIVLRPRPGERPPSLLVHIPRSSSMWAGRRSAGDRSRWQSLSSYLNTSHRQA